MLVDNDIATSQCHPPRARVAYAHSYKTVTNMTRLSLISLACLGAATSAFAPPSPSFSRRAGVRLYEDKDESTTEAVFVPPEQESTEEAPLETVESLGRGAAKVSS